MSLSPESPKRVGVSLEILRAHGWLGSNDTLDSAEGVVVETDDSVGRVEKFGGNIVKSAEARGVINQSVVDRMESQSIPGDVE